MLVQLLEKLINKKYYTDRQSIENKLNVFYAMNKITDEQYSELTLKVDEVYVVETATEEVAIETNNNETAEETIENEITTNEVAESEE